MVVSIIDPRDYAVHDITLTLRIKRARSRLYASKYSRTNKKGAGGSGSGGGKTSGGDSSGDDDSGGDGDDDPDGGSSLIFLIVFLYILSKLSPATQQINTASKSNTSLHKPEIDHVARLKRQVVRGILMLIWFVCTAWVLHDRSPEATAAFLSSSSALLSQT